LLHPAAGFSYIVVRSVIGLINGIAIGTVIYAVWHSRGAKNARNFKSSINSQGAIMQKTPNKLLLAAACCCGLAALAHAGCILFGAAWYRFFGAGEQIAQLAAQGHWYPPVVTGAITFILLLWACYALSAAGLMRRLPFIRLALVLISSIFLVRGLAFVWLMPLFPGNSLWFWLVSSAICLLIGSLFAAGSWQQWPVLSAKAAADD
jgi:hypothetical protein